MDPSFFLNPTKPESSEAPPPPPAAAEIRPDATSAERPAAAGVAVEFQPVAIDTALHTRGFTAFLENFNEEVDTTNQEQVNRAFRLFEASRSVSRRFELAMNQTLREHKKGRMNQKERDEYKNYVTKLAAEKPEELAGLEQDLTRLEQAPEAIRQKKAELELLKQNWNGEKAKEAEDALNTLRTRKTEIEREKQAEKEKLSAVGGKGVLAFIKKLAAKERYEAKLASFEAELTATGEAIALAEQSLSTPSQIVELDAAVRKAEGELIAAREGILGGNTAAENIKERLTEESRAYFESALESTDPAVLKRAMEELERSKAAAGSGLDVLDVIPKPEKLEEGLAEQMKKAITVGIAKALEEIPGESTLRLERALRKFIELGDTSGDLKEFVMDALVLAEEKARQLYKGSGKNILLRHLIARLSAEPAPAAPATPPHTPPVAGRAAASPAGPTESPSSTAPEAGPTAASAVSRAPAFKPQRAAPFSSNFVRPDVAGAAFDAAWTSSPAESNESGAITFDDVLSDLQKYKEVLNANYLVLATAVSDMDTDTIEKARAIVKEKNWKSFDKFAGMYNSPLYIENSKKNILALIKEHQSPSKKGLLGRIFGKRESTPTPTVPATPLHTPPASGLGASVAGWFTPGKSRLEEAQEQAAAEAAKTEPPSVEKTVSEEIAKKEPSTDREEKAESKESLSMPEKIGRAFVEFLKEGSPSYDETVLLQELQETYPEASIKSVFRQTGAHELYFSEAREGSALKAYMVTIRSEHFILPCPVNPQKFETIAGFQSHAAATPETIKAVEPLVVALNGTRWEPIGQGSLT